MGFTKNTAMRLDELGQRGQDWGNTARIFVFAGTSRVQKKDGEVRERTTPPEKLRNWPALIEELVMAGHSNGVQCSASCQEPHWLIYGVPLPGKYEKTKRFGAKTGGN